MGEGLGMIKILAGIVLYNPEEERIIQNIRKILPQVKKVICVDNGSQNIKAIVEKIKKVCNDIEIIRNNENKGISYALNQILNYAYENSYEWFLTLDQDSIAQDDLVNNYKKYLREPELAMLTCKIVDRNFKTKEEEQYEIKDIEKCITSGTLNNTDILKKVGGYDNSMFIDSVDFDICTTLKENNYRIIKINYDGLLHEVGHATVKHFLWKKIKVYNHSPFRTYYIIRNGIYYTRKHKRNINVGYNYFCVLKRSIYILLYQKSRWNNLRAIVKGIHDGIKMEICEE